MQSNNLSFRETLREIWKPVVDWVVFIRKHKELITMGVSFVVLLFAIVEAIRNHASLVEFPLLLLGSFLWVLRYFSIFPFIWFAMIAYLTYHAIYEWIENKWCDRYVKKHKPAGTFSPPYWCFRISAFIPAAVVFLVLAWPVSYLLYELPAHNEIINRMLPDSSSGYEIIHH